MYAEANKASAATELRTWFLEGNLGKPVFARASCRHIDESFERYMHECQRIWSDVWHDSMHVVGHALYDQAGRLQGWVFCQSVHSHLQFRSQIIAGVCMSISDVKEWPSRPTHVVFGRGWSAPFQIHSSAASSCVSVDKSIVSGLVVSEGSEVTVCSKSCTVFPKHTAGTIRTSVLKHGT